MPEYSLELLDQIRCELMKEWLDERGRGEIWKYDVCDSDLAYRLALEDYNFDNIERSGNAKREGKRYCLIGAGICDHPFDTLDELASILWWLCVDSGYLSCCANPKYREVKSEQLGQAS